jgi:Swt1-like HEPN
MDYFKHVLGEYMVNEFKNVYGTDWLDKVLNPSGSDALMTVKKNPKDWDVHQLVNLIHLHWDQVFSKNIHDKFPKSIFTVIKFYRNTWAHQHAMTERDIYRVIDLLELVLSSLNLNSIPLEAKRSELLVLMSSRSAHYQNTQPKFTCEGCKRYFLIHHKFECNSCGLLGCVCCMMERFSNGNNLCPQCNRILNQNEVVEICNKYKYAYNN